MSGKIVAYYRVSTQRQGRSGLGLEAQEAAVATYARSVGAAVVASYTEVETGKKDDLDNRPELRRAIAHAKRSRAVLVIAKLDRLTRSVYVTALLHKSGVEFVCCDQPTANRLTIQILAAVAEDEARRISQRTKDALAAYEARGGALGAARPECRNLTDEARRRGARAAGMVARKNAQAAYEDVSQTIRSLDSEGHSSRSIAKRLNAEGHTTRRGRAWNAVQVRRILNAVPESESAPG